MPDSIRAAHESPRILSLQALATPTGTADGGNGLFARAGALIHPTGVRPARIARFIVGECGSAMHNAVFCRPGTTVVCLNWINGYQSQIATLMGLTQGYILPADGQPRDTARLRSGDRPMRLALADLRASLRPHL